MSTHIHSVYAYEEDGYTPIKLLNWMRKHNIIPIKKAHKIGEQIRYRIKKPDLTKSYSTIVLPNRIHLVVQSN